MTICITQVSNYPHSNSTTAEYGTLDTERYVQALGLIEEPMARQGRRCQILRVERASIGQCQGWSMVNVVEGGNTFSNSLWPTLSPCRHPYTFPYAQDITWDSYLDLKSLDTFSVQDLTAPWLRTLAPCHIAFIFNKTDTYHRS